MNRSKTSLAFSRALVALVALFAFGLFPPRALGLAEAEGDESRPPDGAGQLETNAPQRPGATYERRDATTEKEPDVNVYRGKRGGMKDGSDRLDSDGRRHDVDPRGIVVDPRPPYDHGFRVDVWTDRSTYRVGDSVRIYFRVSRDAYVYIFNTDARGRNRQIFPNYYDRDNHVRGRRTFYIPDRSYDLRVTGPSGWESLRIVAFSRRFDFFRPFDRLDRSDPFPRREGGVDGLLKDLRIAPVPRDHRRYAEDSTRFRVLYGGRPDPWPYDPDPPFGEGRLRIRSDPDGARVYLDNYRRGYTPLTLDDVEPGRHYLRLTKDGYEDYQRRIYIERGETLTIHADLERDHDYPWWDRRRDHDDRGKKYDKDEDDDDGDDDRGRGGLKRRIINDDGKDNPNIERRRIQR